MIRFALDGGPCTNGLCYGYTADERRRCAIKDDMLVYITDVGRKVLAESFATEKRHPKPDPTGCSD